MIRQELPTHRHAVCEAHIDFEKGDLGYLQWHDKAEKSYAAGMRQTQCPGCKRWIWPWEGRTGGNGVLS